MQGIWFERNTHVYCRNSQSEHHVIHSHSAHDALARAQAMGMAQGQLFKIADGHIIDVEESLDLLRLCQTHEYAAQIMLPLDPSVILQADRIGCSSLGIQVAVPHIECGVQRQALLKSILGQIDTEAWAFGGLEPSDILGLPELGFTGVLLDSQYSETDIDVASIWAGSVVKVIMKIVLVRPPRRDVWDSGLCSTLGLAYVASALLSKGYDVQIIDAYAQILSWRG